MEEVEEKDSLAPGVCTRKEPKMMDLQQQKLYDTLKFFHVGKKHAIKKRDLLRELCGTEAAENESYNNVDDRKVRGMIETLINDFGALICSSPDAGYWWAENLDDGMLATQPCARAKCTRVPTVIPDCLPPKDAHF